MRRGLTVVLVVLVAAGAFAATAWIAGGRRCAGRHDDGRAAAARLTIIFPKASRSAKADCVRRGARHRDPQARRHTAPDAEDICGPSIAQLRHRAPRTLTSARGLLLPASYEFIAEDDRTSSSQISSPPSATGSTSTWRTRARRTSRPTTS
jgi:hypothetical protein